MLPVLSERRMFMIAVTPESFASWKLSPTKNGIHEIAAGGLAFAPNGRKPRLPMSG